MGDRIFRKLFWYYRDRIIPDNPDDDFYFIETKQFNFSLLCISGTAFSINPLAISPPGYFLIFVMNVILSHCDNVTLGLKSV